LWGKGSEVFQVLWTEEAGDMALFASPAVVVCMCHTPHRPPLNA
jgi:hypothetical protein